MKFMFIIRKTNQDSVWKAKRDWEHATDGRLGTEEGYKRASWNASQITEEC